MARASNPEHRRGNANPRSLAERPEEIKPTNILAPIVPPIPASLERLKGQDKAMAADLWDAIWTAGGSAYHPATDRLVVERYISLTVRRDKLLRTLEHEGYVTTGSQGQDVAHPAARLVLDIEGKLPALEDRLGLSPEARLRLGITGAEAKSKLDKFREDEI